MSDALLYLAVFVGAMTISYSGARLDLALRERRRLAAANWQALQWGGAVVGFVIAVKISMWALVPDGIGLWLGMFLGAVGGCDVEDGE